MIQVDYGFQIVSTKQEPSFIVNVKTEPEEDDTESYVLLQQNIKSEIETDQQFEGVVDCLDNSRNEIEKGPSEIETKFWRMDQTDSDPVLASHDQQSGILKIPSVKEKRFKCIKCHKMFTHFCHLEAHFRTVHDKIKPFECSLCPYRAAQSSTLKRHILTHTGERKFQCDMCDKKFTLKGPLKQHIITVHDKIKPFPCPHCPYKAGRHHTLKSHILTHTGEKKVKCDICDKEFIRSGHLKQHIITHTREKKCDICGKQFTESDTLKRHIRTVHDKVKPFPCPHCPYKAAQSVNLERHILTHTGEKNFKCDICDKKFTQSGSLKLHIRAVHGRVKAFPCPHCPYKAALNCTLKSHLLTHTGEKNFKCDICDKKFTQNGQLKQHIRAVHDKVRAFPCPHCPYKAAASGSLKDHMIFTHSEEKNYKCDICDKKYTRNRELKHHMIKVHDKISPFSCPHCPYIAAARSNLKRHMLTHSGEKNFKCDICDKKFTESSSLKQHIRTIHDKVKPFPCPHCPYKATQSSNLKSHILTHTGEKNFKCDICDKSFTLKGQLKLHNRTVHEI